MEIPNHIQAIRQSLVVVLPFYYKSYQEIMRNFLCLALVVFVALAQNVPVWHARFQQDFVQGYPTTTLKTTGKIWYDAERNMQRVDRVNGKYNPICGVIKNQTTPCTQLARDGKRYVFYPLLRYCCYCCDAAHGCGIMSQNWTKTLTFVGKEDLSGQTFNKFGNEGENLSFWVTTDGKDVPRKLNEDDELIKDYIMNTFSEEYIASSIFDLPSYCDLTECTAASKCGKFRS